MKRDVAAAAWHVFFRVTTGIGGVGAGLVAMAIPLLAFLSWSAEAVSARQYGFKLSYIGLIGGCVVVLISSGFAGLISYALLRMALKRRKAAFASETG